jgi:hypothetical protein
MVPITRSQWAFMRGVWGASSNTSISSAWKTASKEAAYLLSRSREDEAQGLDAAA